MRSGQVQPPAIIERLLSRFLSPKQLEVSLGDLQEKFEGRISRGSPPWKAKLLYTLEGVGFVRMARRERTHYNANRIDMLRNYFKIAWRTLLKERGYTLINVSSLSIAIAFLALVTLYLQHELSFDRFHSKTDRIFRLSRTTFEADGTISEHDPYLPAPLGPSFASTYPQVSQFTRVISDAFLIRSGEELFQETGAYVDPSFASIFDFPMLVGHRLTGDAGLYDVILTERLAEKLFSQGIDPLGKEIELNIDGKYQGFIVAGIIGDVPLNSTLRFDLLLNMGVFMSSERGRRIGDNWYASFLETYVLLDNPVSATDLSGQMVEFRRSHYPDEIRDLMARELWKDSTMIPTTYYLQNLADIRNDAGFPDSIDPQKYYNLGGIAMVVLILACFNFMLLSLGKARRRSLEIGMRKTMGAQRGQVVVQFWGESILTSLAGMVVGIGLIYFSIPVFNEVVRTNLQFDDLILPRNVAILIGISLVTGVVAGLYPSIILSSMPPVRVMQQQTETRSSLFSRSLITIQFGLSVFFILIALIVAQQISFVKSQDLGIPTVGIVRISARAMDPERLKTCMETFERHSFVKATTAMRARFPLYNNEGWDYEGVYHKAYKLEVDKSFIKMFDVRIVQGRDFSPTEADTTNVILVNEALAATFPGEELLDKPLPGLGSGSTVIGVVKDFNFQSLENKILPMIITANPMARGSLRPRQTLLVKIDLHDAEESLKTLEKDWKSIFPDLPFSHTYLRDDFHAEYARHEQWSMLVVSASCMAVFIACLGLVGFSTLNVNNRLKEIGVRKVMGGSSLQIFANFSIKFLNLVLIGCALAIPVAWQQGNRWLEGFAYRIELTWVLFAAGILVAVALCFIVVSYLLVRISRLNPITILRSE